MAGRRRYALCRVVYVSCRVRLKRSKISQEVDRGRPSRGCPASGRGVFEVVCKEAVNLSSGGIVGRKVAKLLGQVPCVYV